jgi:RNA polymerase sigma-70 factor (ECF subfamily)
MGDAGETGARLGLRTDEELIAEFQRGNAAAFSVLVDRYRDPLTNYLYRFLGDWDECRDAVQDTFVRVFQNRNAYKPIAKFSTWMYTIATNVAKSRLRRRSVVRMLPLARRGVEGEPEYDVADESTRADLQLESHLAEERIQHALDALPTKHREVILLRDVQGLSYEEIAGISGLSMGTVKSRINRARQKLQEMLKDER